jgi:excisionase family DNA binding protein
MPIELGGEKLYKVEEISELFGISKLTIRTYIRDGLLKGRKLGRQWIVPEKNIKKYFGLDENGSGEK